MFKNKIYQTGYYAILFDDREFTRGLKFNNSVPGQMTIHVVRKGPLHSKYYKFLNYKKPIMNELNPILWMRSRLNKG